MKHTKRTMVCAGCTMRIKASCEQAKRHGWTVWIGGALCKSCTLEARKLTSKWPPGPVLFTEDAEAYLARVGVPSIATPEGEE